MFENLNWWELLALLVLAFLIFGEKLPKVIGDGLRMVRNLRQMARNATGDLGRELGTDLTLEDLHPKTLIRKHLLSEEDEQALRQPLDGLVKDLRGHGGDVRDTMEGARSHLRDAVEEARPRSEATVRTVPPADPAGTSPGSAAAPRARDFDAT
ncbi:hypothetical protein GCM10010124_23860 [Pilimelia terevasa]|uniref:Sec-independent protein translocase protein TatB n=1 Tax=Pilimelia terevasa TaxID=53372 RepID=A0A8J3BSA9_9ACTN|nr:preprotein translocase subunit TatB [Pilimelia terevasa]GGK30312.1 hypothetical protein GCM10010124_23860 [Pilimelia terevasa]